MYNLRQENKSVNAYYDEFQKLLLNLDYNEDEVQTKVWFKVGLNQQIYSSMSIHKFSGMDDLLEYTINVKRDIKVEKD